jgi:hypothetical protein
MSGGGEPQPGLGAKITAAGEEDSHGCQSASFAAVSCSI